MRALSLLVLLGCAGSEAVSTSVGRELPDDLDPLSAPLDRLRAATRSTFGFKAQNGAVVSLIGDFAVAGATPIERARAFVAANADVYARGAAPTLRVRRSSSRRVGARSIDHVTLRQQIDGVDVLGAELAVMLDGGRVRAAGGYLLPTRPVVELAAKLTPHEGEVAARGFGAHGPRNASPRLGIVDRRVSGARWTGNEPARLVWQIAYGNELWWIDAHDGSLVRHDDGEREISLQIYDAKDDDEQKWDSDDGGCVAASCSSVITSTVTNMTATYNFYKNTYNWVGYDGDDSDHEVYARATRSKYASYFDEEFWIRDEYHNALDIFGHEFTHGVIEHRSDLEYNDEAGALNESFADLMGNLIENDTFPVAQLGEDGKNGAGAIRDTCDQPIKHYTQYTVDPDDHGGVHSNSGIPNNAWCRTAQILESMGDVPLVAKHKMSDVAYALMGSLPGEAMIHVAASFAIVEFNQQFDPKNGDPWAHACAAWRAWDYAGVTINGPMQTRCFAAPDEDLDGIPDADDNCVTKDNPGQDNLDGDGLGDVCDTDKDGDGRANSQDNCRWVPNPEQFDFDDDGIGDACEDSDGDHHLDADDNCPEDANPFQQDTDEDGLGDACEIDADGDSFIDDTDTCQFTKNTIQLDSDGDGLGDACDPCVNGADTVIAYTAGFHNGTLDLPPAPIVEDSDGDGISDGCDTKRFGSLTIDGKNPTATDVRPGRSVRIAGALDLSSPLSVPIQVCPDRDCVRYHEQAPLLVSLTNARGLRTRVLDDRGRVVARDSRTASSLSFSPRGGRSYRLEISSPVATTANVTIAVTGGE
jgi:hypothetical protein